MAVGERDRRPVIVSGGADGTMRGWDLQTGEPVLELVADHRGEVYAVAVGERDRRPVIVSGGADGTIRVWDLQTGEPVLDPLTGHDGKVYAVAVGERDGRPVIVSGGADSTVRVWDLQSGGHAALRIALQDLVLSVTSTADELEIGTATELLRIDLG